jgi:hypothetical protein
VIVSNFSGGRIDGNGILFTTPDCIINVCMSPFLERGEAGAILLPTPPNGMFLPASDQDVVVDVKIAGAPLERGETGTELPVARETDFVDTSLRFSRVPVTDEDVRVTLRIYGFPEDGETKVRVEIGRTWSLTSVEQELDLSLRQAPPIARVEQPAFASQTLFLSPEQQDPRGVDDRVVVSPLPRADGSRPRIWGFITVTDNETQAVRVQVPQ